tara:strand:+ start:561 stop:1154 length:594 start_codon:yes stop_codon:yes gene_type:complete
MKVTPFECYKTYIAMKQHFTKDKYDYFKYGGKSRASATSFNNRKDRYFFERMSRKKSDEQIVQYFISNFISTEDPSKVWIGEIIKNGETNFQDWQKRNQSLAYVFGDEIERVFKGSSFDSYFDSDGQHPKILKEYLKGEVSIETLVILDRILGYAERFDKKILDPIWGAVSLKIKKYKPFLNIDVSRYKKILKEKVL